MSGRKHWYSWLWAEMAGHRAYVRNTNMGCSVSLGPSLSCGPIHLSLAGWHGHSWAVGTSVDSMSIDMGGVGKELQSAQQGEVYRA